jgi:carboxylesterase type B
MHISAEYHILLLSLLLTHSHAQYMKAPTATIDAGVVIGKSTTLPTALGPVNQFLGIPFAQSPPERFSPPEQTPQFPEPINATEWKPACIQQFRCKFTLMRVKCLN